ncbi:MAG: anthrax toxin-like adenylyl cyclase domain-containing protein [Janthinobacterium lividum]
MEACLRSAAILDEVIVFRSTGPWSKRWLSPNPPYPSKNFHVKGKSSDWGPQAGFVPHLGEYSKVGHQPTKAAAGTAQNDLGVASGFAGRVTLNLSRGEIEMQATQPCEVPERVAIAEVRTVRGRDVLVLGTFRSGDNMRFNFIAVPNGARFDIMLPPPGGVSGHMDILLQRLAADKIDLTTLKPLEVMASLEVGAGGSAMTGDYDLMAICPRWSNYMARSDKEITKAAIVLSGHGHAAGAQTFARGSAMDKTLDARLHTGAKTNVGHQAQLPVNGAAKAFEEHGDMGNITPRILRAINQLNIDMGAIGPNAALRRVHHNAESHRHATFGALVSRDMEKGDGFPLTAFHPPSAMGGPNGLARFGAVCTIERMAEFQVYAGAVHDAGFYVPKHWAWNMSIRDAGRAVR